MPGSTRSSGRGGPPSLPDTANTDEAYNMFLTADSWQGQCPIPPYMTLVPVAEYNQQQHTIALLQQRVLELQERASSASGGSDWSLVQFDNTAASSVGFSSVANVASLNSVDILAPRDELAVDSERLQIAMTSRIAQEVAEGWESSAQEIVPLERPKKSGRPPKHVRVARHQAATRIQAVQRGRVVRALRQHMAASCQSLAATTKHLQALVQVQAIQRGKMVRRRMARWSRAVARIESIQRERILRQSMARLAEATVRSDAAHKGRPTLQELQVTNINAQGAIATDTNVPTRLQVGWSLWPLLVLIGLMVVVSLFELDKKVHRNFMLLELDKKATSADIALASNSNVNQTYMKLELDKKASKTDVIAALAQKVDKSQVEHELEKKAEKSECNPAGVIVMWSGSSASVPPGWALCDGDNGTPNLVGRFILAAGEGNEHKKGGRWENRISVEQLPHRRHKVHTDTDVHSHHYDRVPKGTMAWKQKRGGKNRFGDGEYNPQYGGKQTRRSSHRHKFTTESVGDGQPVPLAPPYYALAFIMKL